jgi:hypothetical protein
MAPFHVEQTALFLTPVDETGEGFTYSVRRSKRAKRVQLSVTPEKGLVVVIPERFAERHVPSIVEERREWIRVAFENLAAERAFYTERAKEPLVPLTIELRALGERRSVVLQPQNGTPLRVKERGPYQLVVSGDYDEIHAQKALQRWLARRTKTDIVPWLNELGEARSLVVRGTSVRNQRTRWGSCSADGRISINQNLLFLPRRLARLVLVHELSHLRELNHSPRFWQILKEEEPDLDALSEELDLAWRFIPRWAHE